MRFRRHQGLQLVATAIAAVAGSAFASAQDYPTRPIMTVVGYAVGGPSDTIARILAERMSVSLGERLVIENVTGASGSIEFALSETKIGIKHSSGQLVAECPPAS
jgi:tripartite-type tricarboxylate transporter receptor subunit TctC